MNIFYIDHNPYLAASSMADKHISKMIVESAQMLSTAHRVLDGQPYTHISKKGRKIKRYNHPLFDHRLYQSAYVNHPCNVWIRESYENYIWLYDHFAALCREYELRFDKTHKTDLELHVRLSFAPNNIPRKKMTKVAQAMPNEYKNNDPIVAYRNFYISKKFLTLKDKQRFTNKLIDKKT
jgi:single-stranded DNA-specific DHH superfamily exonuclease